MKRIVGYVREVTGGMFYASNCEGERRCIHENSNIFLNETVVGSITNFNSDAISVGIIDSTETVVITGREVQLFDAQLLSEPFDSRDTTTSFEVMQRFMGLKKIRGDI
jgi:hypothetical protein